MVAKRPITAEEFARMPESRYAELIDGEVVFPMPTARGHGGVVANLMYALKQWAEPETKGYVSTEEGVIIGRSPDRVRGPDVLYLSAEKAKAHQNTDDSFWEVQPNLVAEVISNNETADEVQLKLRECTWGWMG